MDKYQQIIQCLETPKLFDDVSKQTGIVRGSLHLMMARLLETGKVKREKMPSTGRNKFYIYTRLVDTVNRAEVIKQVNYKNVVESRNSGKDIIPNARVFAERHVPREKKKSPRVYVGCSFGLVGW
jgi:predicted transcriptional regulator